MLIATGERLGLSEPLVDGFDNLFHFKGLRAILEIISR